MNNPTPKTMADRLLDVVIQNDPGEKHPKSKMADICGISQSAVYQWFTDTKEPKATHIGSVCSYYRADPLWVLVGDRIELTGAIDDKCDTKFPPNTQKFTGAGVEELVNMGNVQ